MTTTFSLRPLLRSTVGFDRFNDLFESLVDAGDPAVSYPPYNIEKRGEDKYAITMAVAGFTDRDLNIVVQSDRVTVSGRIEQQAEEDVEYLYRGIAARAFERSFRLADHLKVTGAEIRDGMLRIELVREVPEEQKPRTVQIKSGSASRSTIEHAANETQKAA